MQPYEVTSWAASSDVCDYCEEGAEYRVHRHALFVSREGAALHTADELAHLLMSDALDIMAAEGMDEDDADPTYWNMHAECERYAALLDAARDPVSGCAWIEPTDDDAAIADVVPDYEEQLGNLGYFVTWNEGYVIERIDDAADMTDDGDTVALFDGSTLRLRVEADIDYNGFEDADCYGRIGYARRNVDTGRGMRPDGFDGNAERIGRDSVWWQPPADVKRTDEGFRALRSLVTDLLEYGWHTVGCEVLRGTDAYGRPVVVGAAWLGGIDVVDAATLSDVVPDLANEATAEASKVRA